MSWELDPKGGLRSQILAPFYFYSLTPGLCFSAWSLTSHLLTPEGDCLELVTTPCTFDIKVWVSNIKKLPT